MAWIHYYYVYIFDLYAIIIYLLIITTFITFVLKYKTIVRFLKFFIYTCLSCVVFVSVLFIVIFTIQVLQ